MPFVLGANQYGKAEVRLVHVDRSSPRHVIRDVTVTTQLRGRFEAAHLVGDNAALLPTDTQKNAVYVLARRHGIGSPEAFALLLGRHFLAGAAPVAGARITVDAHPWQRVPTGEPLAGTLVDGHDHAFIRAGTERRTTVVTFDGDQATVVSGLADLVVLKSTGSEFHGYVVDDLTTLPETTERILATSVTAWWRYGGAALDPDFDFDAAHGIVRTAMISTFASLHSLALQQTLYAMGTAAMTACDAIDEVRLSMPNKHHFLVDLSPFHLDNPHAVYHAADRPYGLIEGAVLREGVAPGGPGWDSILGLG